MLNVHDYARTHTARERGRRTINAGIIEITVIYRSLFDIFM
jgi:hypothetical protein